MLVFKGKKPIKSVSFLKTNQDPDIAIKKTSVVDILCTDENDNQYIVEMQVAREKGFIKRAQYYASKTYASQLGVGGKYHNLKEVIFLAISNFIMFPKKKSGKSDHVILDRETHENDLNDFSFSFLELPKFKQNSDQLRTMIEKWAYFFNHCEEMTPEELATSGLLNDPAIGRAYEELNRFSWSEEELRKYEESQKIDMDNEAVLDQKFDEGMEKGMEKGTEKNARSNAKNFIRMGLPLEQVAKGTELSIEIVKELEKEIQNENGKN